MFQRTIAKLATTGSLAQAKNIWNERLAIGRLPPRSWRAFLRSRNHERNHDKTDTSMRHIRALLWRLSELFKKRRPDSELEEELESHVALHEEDNLRSGMAPAEARRQALIKLGGMEQARQMYREQAGLPLLETLLQDVRYGLRMLRKNPGFSTVAIVTLALGIGANTAIFSIVNGVLLRQLPFKNPDQLMSIWSNRTDRDKTVFSLPDFLDYKEQNRTLEQISGFSAWNANLSNAGEPERVFGVRSSANVFQMLGVYAEIGRTLLDEDDIPSNPRVLVLSHGFWKRRFGMKADVIGKQLLLNDENYTVAGVLPPGSRFPKSKLMSWCPWCRTQIRCEKKEAPSAICGSSED